MSDIVEKYFCGIRNRTDYFVKLGFCYSCADSVCNPYSKEKMCKNVYVYIYI